MNYIGSKFSLLDFIQDTVYRVTGYEKGDSFVFGDVFTGTGVVGAKFKENGCTVIANDIQHYSYIRAKHYIENISPIDVSLLKDLNNLSGVEGFIYQNYCSGSGSGRNYFTDENGKKCDAIRQKLESLYETGEIDDSQYTYFLASLINSIDKVANTASVYGAFLKHIKKSAEKEFQLGLLPIVDGPADGVVYNEDVNSLMKKIKGDVLYLDPPYNARQYASNYHVLETISKYDNPILKGKTGLRDYSEQKSDFCSSRKVEAAFENLIKAADFEHIFLSYNNEGLMSLDTIKDIFSSFGDYSVETKAYKRFRADKAENRNHKASSTLEYLHCLKKK